MFLDYFIFGMKRTREDLGSVLNLTHGLPPPRENSAKSSRFTSNAGDANISKELNLDKNMSILVGGMSALSVIEDYTEDDLEELSDEILHRVGEIQRRDLLERNLDLQTRLNSFKKNISTVIFEYVNGGLFEKDKLTVATLITLRIMVKEGLLTQVC